MPISDHYLILRRVWVDTQYQHPAVLPAPLADPDASLSAQDFDMVAINADLEITQSTSLVQRVAKNLKLGEYPEFQRQTLLTGPLGQLGLSRNHWIAASLAVVVR
jgi:uncharacterized protein involved in exopolysaccharide biosynthesis